ncbi:MAG: hypothetical protein ACYCUG_00105 [Acidimicrobiales bacterium]
MPNPAFTVIRHLLGVIRARLAEARHDEAGYTTETILVTALLAAAALAAVGYLVTLIIAKAHSITL